MKNLVNVPGAGVICQAETPNWILVCEPDLCAVTAKIYPELISRVCAWMLSSAEDSMARSGASSAWRPLS